MGVVMMDRRLVQSEQSYTVVQNLPALIWFLHRKDKEVDLCVKVLVDLYSPCMLNTVEPLYKGHSE